jgi:hypothetical protein
MCLGLAAAAPLAAAARYGINRARIFDGGMIPQMDTIHRPRTHGSGEVALDIASPKKRAFPREIRATGDGTPVLLFVSTNE